MEKGPKSHTHSIPERRIESEDNFASFMKFEVKILYIKLDKNLFEIQRFRYIKAHSLLLGWRD